MIPTYEQKLIWTNMQGMTTLIHKLEPFLGDAYQSRPDLKNGSNLSITIVIRYILVQINFCSYVGITYNLPVIHK